MGVVAGWLEPTGERINLENELRQCCPLYRSYGCPSSEYQMQFIMCSRGKSIDDLRKDVGLHSIDQLQVFCSCDT